MPRGTIPRKVGEEWRLVEGTDDFFISNFGRFRHKKKLMKLAVATDGYLTCNIGHKRLKVHRLVAQAFIPNPENKPVVDHIDANKQNNRVENLRWATVKENTQAAYDMGLIKRGKINQVIAINEFNDAFIFKNQREAADYIGVEQATIYRVTCGNLKSVKGFKVFRIKSLTDKRDFSSGRESKKIF